MGQRSSKRAAAIALATMFILGACTGADAGAPTSTLGGSVAIDGSSTVYPITEAVAEEFQLANTGVQVSAAFSGTGGGFKLFCTGETDVNDASRPIKADDEGEGVACESNGVEYVELQVAIDGLTVVVNPENTFATCLTVEELALIYGPDSPQDLTWQDVRADFPAEPINRFMPGADSGTFDYFTEEINGEVDAATQFATPSEDDNVLVTGRRRRRQRNRVLRIRLLRRERGQGQGDRGRWRRGLRRADRGDDQHQRIRTAQPTAVHLPGCRQGEGATRAEGLRGLLPREHQLALR